MTSCGCACARREAKLCEPDVSPIRIAAARPAVSMLPTVGHCVDVLAGAEAQSVVVLSWVPIVPSRQIMSHLRVIIRPKVTGCLVGPCLLRLCAAGHPLTPRRGERVSDVVPALCSFVHYNNNTGKSAPCTDALLTGY